MGEPVSHLKSGVYAIININDGRRYVGSSVNIRYRFTHHRSLLRAGKHHSIHLQAAWNKYGSASFAFRILELCAECDLRIREQFHLDEEFHYNISPTAGSIYGVKLTAEQRAKRGEIRRGKKHTPEARALMSAAKKGIKRPFTSDKMRAAISAGKTGKPLSAEHKARISATRKGVPWSESQRAKMVLAKRMKKESRVAS